MAKWEYALVQASLDDGNQWIVDLIMPDGNPHRIEDLGPLWHLEVANILGVDEWEMVDRSAIRTGGNSYVSGWQMLFKRDLSAMRD
jgi:hypothetical protein